MKIRHLFFLNLIISFASFSQKQPKDTVETEVVEIITTFNPNIADAQKIRNNPNLEFSKRTAKKELNYNIFSAPVASTFIPKSGVIKRVDVGIKERLYKNYIAAGYGNFATPFFEAFLHSSSRFRNEFGINLKYLASNNNIQNTQLNSTFANFNANVFYKKEDRYFNWKVGLQTERNQHNWYGLPQLNFTDFTLNSIEETQEYNFVKVFGNFTFNDSYIDYASVSFSSFSDRFDSNEIHVNFSGKLNYPLYKISSFFNTNNDITLFTNIAYLKGSFEKNYAADTSIDYGIFTSLLEPRYRYNYKSILINAGLKTIFSLDSENNVSDFFLLPNLHATSKLYKQYVSIYAGLKSDLHTNTYQNFSSENPFVSPTLFITQTLEKNNVYLGLNGNITNAITYNFKASFKNEEDKPLFLRNNSKSDGAIFTANGKQFLGYEFGNSFQIFYDNVKTTAFFGEFAYEFSKKLSFNAQFTYSNFTLTNAFSPWNLPSIEAVFRANYKADKWFANTHIFYVDERTDVLYNSQFPSSLGGVQTLDSFIDVNLNGGYHINRKLSAFLNVNNLLNNQYQRFANFNVQGFQILGGITYKFDF